MTKDDLRLALRLAFGELDMKIHSATLNGIVNHALCHLEKFENPPVVPELNQLDLFIDF